MALRDRGRLALDDLVGGPGAGAVGFAVL